MRMFIMGVIFGGLWVFIALSSCEYVPAEMFSKQPNILDDCNVVSKTIYKGISGDKFYINCESRTAIEVDKNLYERYQVKSTDEKSTLLYKFISLSIFDMFISIIVIAVVGTILILLYEKFNNE